MQDNRYSYHLGITTVGPPYDNTSELSSLRKRTEFAKREVDREPICPMPKCCASKSTAWKFWTVAISLLLLLCLIGIAIVVAWTRNGDLRDFGDGGPQGPELPPAVCYKCSNYEHLMDGRQINDGSDLERTGDGSGAVEVVGALGVAVDVENPRGSLCQELVNRTALTETQSPEDDDCGDSIYNGCFKMVTKSYRLTANVGREQLSATVVTRNCMHIPNSLTLGCYKTFGGAGMERETCYCKGIYCNTQIPLKPSTLLVTFICILITLPVLF